MKEDFNSIKVLGAFGTKTKDYGTSSFYLNEKNVIDAGNLLIGLEQESAKIQHIWLTHSHLDHISDISYIIDNYYGDIKQSIHIHALPQTLKAIKEHFLNDIIWPDFSKIRLADGSDVCIKYVEVEFDKEYVLCKNESIRAFKTDHTVPSCGYIYKQNGSGVLITSDTHSLDSAIEIMNSDRSISSMVVECSFPSSMESLAKASKHLTPKLISKMMKNLKTESTKLYINHIKPTYLEDIKYELKEYCGALNPQLLLDGKIIKF